MKARIKFLVIGFALGPLFGGCGVTVSDSQTSGNVPRIVQVVFPSTILGNGVTQYATIKFKDEDAGVHWLRVSNVECPPDNICSDGEVDLTQIDPAIPDQTSGSFEIGFSCENASGETATSEWELRLYDYDDHESAPGVVQFDCESI